jgi:hypothetical protein
MVSEIPPSSPFSKEGTYSAGPLPLEKGGREGFLKSARLLLGSLFLQGLQFFPEIQDLFSGIL